MSMFHELMMRKKGMPERYQEVEYIQSDGNAYIDTGIIGTGNLTLDFKYQSAQNSSAIFGARTSYHNRDLSLFQISGGARFDYFGSHLSGIGLSSNTINRVVTQIENNDYIVNAYDENDVLLGTKSTVVVNNTTPTTIKLFGVDTNGTVSVNNCIIYFFNIYDNNRLLRNYIPVYDTLTQKYGMWESVHGKFYGNDGTGDFGGSIVGYTVVGSPTITDGVVSGFSSANYLYLPSAPSWRNIDVLETFTTFTTSTMNTLQIVMCSRYSQATCCVEITSANKPLFRITYSDSGGTTKYKETTINYVLSANTKYKVKNYFNKQTLVIKSELYDENGIMLASESSSLASDYTFIANINDFWYGYNPQRGTFNGSIDLNNTYIKINNKLWFNGQQA